MRTTGFRRKALLGMDAVEKIKDLYCVFSQDGSHDILRSLSVESGIIKIRITVDTTPASTITPSTHIRTMASTLTTVKEEKIRIGDTIPPYTVTTVELEWNRPKQDEFNKFYPPLARRLIRNPSANNDNNNETAQFNMKSYRRLCHMSYSPSLEGLYQATYGKNKVLDINRWGDYHDHGLTWFMTKAKHNYAMPTISNRASCAYYLANSSPKLRYLCKLLLAKVIDQKRRLLIFAEWPMTQWHLEMFLMNLGFHTLSLQSKHTDEEKIIIVNKFNDPKSNIDILVTTYRTCIVSINLHKACSDCVMVEPAINTNMVLQTIGCVHQLDQNVPQTITILFLNHSFNRHIEYNQAKKMISQIAEQGKEVFRNVVEMARATQSSAPQDSDPDEPEEDIEVTVVKGEADQILQQMLGQCRSRLGWDDPMDLGRSAMKTRSMALDRGQGILTFLYCSCTLELTKADLHTDSPVTPRTHWG